MVSERSSPPPMIERGESIEPAAAGYQSRRASVDLSEKSPATATREEEEERPSLGCDESLGEKSTPTRPGADMENITGADEFILFSGMSSILPSLSPPVDGQPVNFGVVVPGVYRSSYPQLRDYDFLKNLKLKSIITLGQKDLPDSYGPFMTANGIRHYVFDMKGTKKEAIPPKTMKAILSLVLDVRNHPLLIHCNHGKHRTGCVVGVVRKVAGWEVATIVDEYKQYAKPKVRDCDIDYISGFELASLSSQFVEKPSSPFRVRNFFRATVFAIVVLFVWMFTGSTITHAERIESDE